MRLFAALVVVSAALAVTLLSAGSARSFSTGGCEGDCKKCHSLSKKEVSDILGKLKLTNAKILNIQLSPVKSLWEVTLEDAAKPGQPKLIYIDFSKKHIIAGAIVEVASGANMTQERAQALWKVDPAKIPVAGALVLGNAKAAKRVIVFTDPDCPFCEKLHRELQKVASERKDIVFFIKLLPLPMHKDAYWKSKSILCNKSLKMLEDNFDKKPIAKTECDTKEVDETMKTAASLGITGTPTLVLPNGTAHSGYLPADKLIELVTGRR